MILVALGSNVAGPWGSPRQAVERAIAELDHFPVRVVRASTLIETAPFGVANQPNFVNGVVAIETALAPQSLLRRLHTIEKAAGRRRRRRWGPRTLDLDIIDWNGITITSSLPSSQALVLPHPGISQRSFVLQPIAEIAPRWKHPASHCTATEMLKTLGR